MRAQYATRAYSNLDASGRTEDRSAELVVLLFNMFVLENSSAYSDK